MELAVSFLAIIYIHYAAMRLSRGGTRSLEARGMGAQVRWLKRRVD